MIKNIRMNRHPKKVAVISTSCEESSTCWYSITFNMLVGETVGEKVGKMVGEMVGEIVGEDVQSGRPISKKGLFHSRTILKTLSQFIPE